MQLPRGRQQPARMGRYANFGEVRQSKPPRRRREHKHFLWFWNMSKKKKAMVILTPFLLFLLIVPILTYLYYARDISDQERLMNRNNTGIVLNDVNNKPLYSVGRAQHRNMVKLADISDSMKNALLASEDKDFYKHPGFSLIGIFRAAFQRHGGGSTITQQLAKNTVLTSEQTFMRKYQELFVALAIEQNYTKDQILEMYLNSVYYGEDSFGIEEAAKIYFGKAPKDLTLAESAMLVGVLPAPTAYSPISGDPEKAKQRQKTVLGRMVDVGAITNEQKDAAYAQQLSYASTANTVKSIAPHFAQMVINQLKQKLYSAEDKNAYDKLMRSGYQVKTTLNMDTQQMLIDNVSKQIPYLNNRGGTNASGVVIDVKTGRVRALVGSADYNNPQWGNVNMATTPRQPGSSFKPIYYAGALAEGVITPATIFQDKPTDFGGGYQPLNADQRWHGNVTTRRAISWSLNIPSVEIMKKFGISKSVQTANNLGISSITQATGEKNGLSLALGSGEASLTQMTNAYAAFGNQGQQFELGLIEQVNDKYNKKVSWPNATSKRAISEGGAYLISNILSDNSARASVFGSTLTVPGHTAAVKTGTTNDNKDAWTIGYNPEYAVGVWVGNNDNTPMKNGGSDMAGPIWRNTMTKLLAGQSNTQFPVPSGVVQRSVCTSDGGLATTENAKGTYKEYFLTGALPTKQCNVVRTKIEVCNLSDKKMESIYEDDFDSTKHSKNSSDCSTTKQQIRVCDVERKRIIAIDEKDFDSSRYSKNIASCRSSSSGSSGNTSDDSDNSSTINGNTRRRNNTGNSGNTGGTSGDSSGSGGTSDDDSSGQNNQNNTGGNNNNFFRTNF